jgi:hypothetical protein
MALTASTIVRESMGSMTLHIVTFATVTTAADTYSSGLPGIVAVWANATTCNSLGLNGASAGLTTASSGVVTVAAAVAGSVKLFIASRS